MDSSRGQMYGTYCQVNDCSLEPSTQSRGVYLPAESESARLSIRFYPAGSQCQAAGGNKKSSICLSRPGRLAAATITVVTALAAALPLVGNPAAGEMR